MATLNDFSVVDFNTDALALYYNKLLGSIFRKEFSNAVTMTTDITLTDGDTPIQRLNCNGANRVVKMPVGANGNHPFMLINTTSSGGWILTVKSNDGADTLKTLDPGEQGYFVPDGNGEYIDLVQFDGSVYVTKDGLTDWDEQGSNPSTPAANKWKLFFKAGGMYFIDDAGTVVGPLDVRDYLAKNGLTEWDEQGSNPSTPAANKWKLYFKADGLYLIDDAGVVTGPLAIAGNGGIYPCYTRVSVDPTTPNPTTDYSAQTSFSVIPYGGGNTYSQWNGTAFVAQVFAALAFAMNAAHLSGILYDIYLWLDSGTVRVVTGPAWATSTSRGTGAGTAEIETLYGVDVNKVQMTVRNGASTYTMPARMGTLIGTICPSANGQFNWSKTDRGLTNHYNQLFTSIHTCPGYVNDDAQTTWSITTGNVYAQANGGSGSDVKFVLSRPQTINIVAQAALSVAAYALFGVGYDTTTSIEQVAWIFNAWHSVTCPSKATASIGRHTASLLVRASAAVTFIADNLRLGSTRDNEMTFLDGTILA
jgi:hypothetical protein